MDFRKILSTKILELPRENVVKNFPLVKIFLKNDIESRVVFIRVLKKD